MAEIKDPKRYYYAMRSKYMREARQIRHRLSLATTDAEDALQWEQYQKVLRRWRALEIPEGVKAGKPAALQEQVFRKPVLNDAYIELTVQLKALYAERSRAKTRQERSAIEHRIRLLKKQRAVVTAYVDRIC